MPSNTLVVGLSGHRGKETLSELCWAPHLTTKCLYQASTIALWLCKEKTKAAPSPSIQTAEQMGVDGCKTHALAVAIKVAKQHLALNT